MSRSDKFSDDLVKPWLCRSQIPKVSTCLESNELCPDFFGKFLCRGKGDHRVVFCVQHKKLFSSYGSDFAYGVIEFASREAIPISPRKSVAVSKGLRNKFAEFTHRL